MKLIEPSVEILEQSSGLNGIYEQIEIAGRTCYKSEPTYSYFYTGKNPHDGGDITVQVSKEFDGEKAIEYAEKEYLNGNPSYSRRSASAKVAHPDMQVLANKLNKNFVSLFFIRY